MAIKRRLYNSAATAVRPVAIAGQALDDVSHTAIRYGEEIFDLLWQTKDQVKDAFSEVKRESKRYKKIGKGIVSPFKATARWIKGTLQAVVQPSYRTFGRVKQTLANVVLNTGHMIEYAGSAKKRTEYEKITNKEYKPVSYYDWSFLSSDSAITQKKEAIRTEKKARKALATKRAQEALQYELTRDLEREKIKQENDKKQREKELELKKAEREAEKLRDKGLREAEEKLRKTQREEQEQLRNRENIQKIREKEQEIMEIQIRTKQREEKPEPEAKTE